jgi:hypothetical protein
MKREGTSRATADPTSHCYVLEAFDAQQKRNDSANAALVGRFVRVSLFEVV